MFPSQACLSVPQWLLERGWTSSDWDELGVRWQEDVSVLLSVDTYLRVHFCSEDRLAFARDQVSKAKATECPVRVHTAEAFDRRVHTYLSLLLQDLHSDSVPAPTGYGSPWLLSPKASESVKCVFGNLETHARLCCNCAESLARKPELDPTDGCYRHLMPKASRVDGFWGGPMPAELAALGPLAVKIIRLAHVSCSILRVKLSPEEFIRKTKANLRIPAFVTGNAMAVPQYGQEFPQVLGALPEQLSAHIQVQFDGDFQWIKNEAAITVSVPVLKEAFRWLLTHNWHWILATANDSMDIAAGDYGPRLNALLQAYTADLGGEALGVPKSVLEIATPLERKAAAQSEPGPVDAATDDNAPTMASAALLSSGISRSSALEQVQKVLHEHQQIANYEEEAARNSNEELKMQCIRLELLSLEKVRGALEKLTSSSLRAELLQELQTHSDSQPVVRGVISCGKEFLKSYAPDFWAKTFVEAFPRGDCQEKPGSCRVHPTFGVEWTTVLLDQMDKPWLRCHQEWLATAMLYFIRLEQIRKTETFIVHSSKLQTDAAVFHRLHAPKGPQAHASPTRATEIASWGDDYYRDRHISVSASTLKKLRC